jgi:hypothetical protein
MTLQPPLVDHITHITAGTVSEILTFANKHGLKIGEVLRTTDENGYIVFTAKVNQRKEKQV